MKTYLATVCLTKSYTNPICNHVLLQKNFSDKQTAYDWLNKALKRFGYVGGIKGRDGQNLCFVSWFAIDNDGGEQILYFDYFDPDEPHEIFTRVTLTKKYPSNNKTVVLREKCDNYSYATLFVDWAYLQYANSDNAAYSGFEMLDIKTGIVIDKKIK